MTNRLMISVAAAALIAGTSFANAQGMGREGGSGSTMQQQQSAPSSERGNSAAPANRDAVEPSSGQSSGMKSTQSEEKSSGATKNQRAQGNMQDPKSKGMNSENEGTKNGAKDMKAQGREDNNTAQGREDRNTAQGQGREDRNTAQGREDRNGAMNAQSKGAESKSSTTVGQAGAGAKLSTEQRTKITTVIRSQHVAPVEHVNFSISVGTRVPHDVRFYPLPTEVVTIYPEWRGYEFILVGEQVVVIDPGTFEIVAVLEA